MYQNNVFFWGFISFMVLFPGCFMQPDIEKFTLKYQSVDPESSIIAEKQILDVLIEVASKNGYEYLGEEKGFEKSFPDFNTHVFGKKNMGPINIMFTPEAKQIRVVSVGAKTEITQRIVQDIENAMKNLDYLISLDKIEGKGSILSK